MGSRCARIRGLRWDPDPYLKMWDPDPYSVDVDPYLEKVGSGFISGNIRIGIRNREKFDSDPYWDSGRVGSGSV